MHRQMLAVDGLFGNEYASQVATGDANGAGRAKW